MSILTERVLVVNRSFLPIEVTTVRKAVTKVGSEGSTAKIIDCINNFQCMTWEDWTALRPNPNYCPHCHEIKNPEEVSDGKCLVCDRLVGERGIQGVDTIYRVPRVIMESSYNKPANSVVRYNRRTLFQRDQNQCQYCGRRPGTKELNLDHVHPRSKGGKSTWENVVVSCTDCNTKKGDKTLAQCGMKLRRQPTKPKYNLDLGSVRIRDWESFVSEAFWLTTLDNDNEE